MTLKRVLAAHRAERGLILKRSAQELGSAILGVPSKSLRIAYSMPSGRPVLMVGNVTSPISLSFSHLDDVVAVAIDDEHTVGIDLVRAEDAKTLSAWMPPMGSDSGYGADLAAYSWAAREAAFKAAVIDRPFRPDEIQILLTGGRSFRWSAVEAGSTVSGDGHFELHASVICAIAVRRGRMNGSAIHD
jgi:phosphopantetheinyl transferase